MDDPIPVPENPDIPAEVRLKRFLYLGIESPKYYPGNWSAHGYFVPEKMFAIVYYLLDNEKCLELVEIVKKVYETGSYSRIEPLVFTLVMCLRIGSTQLIQAVYKVVPTICKQPKDLFLFAKYCRKLGKGTGIGWRRCIQRWYIDNTPLQLAKEISIRIRYNKISHKDLIKLAHVSAPEDDFARKCVYDYVLCGYKSTQKKFASKPEAIEILNVFKNASELRVCEDPRKAAEIIKKEGYIIDHIPGHFLCDQMIWEALIPNLTTVDLLHSLLRIHNMGFLDIGSSTVPILKSALSTRNAPRPVAANTSKQGTTANHDNTSTPLELHPVLVYITLCNYNKLGRPMAYPRLKIESQKESKRISRELISKMTELTVKQRQIARDQATLRNSGKSHSPNPVIIESLLLLLKESWQLPVATGGSYMITLDMRDTMFIGIQDGEIKQAKNYKKKTTQSVKPKTWTSTKHLHPYNKCFYQNNVTAGHAAIVLALQIFHREKDVTVAVFTDAGVQCVSLGNKKFAVDIEQVEDKLRSAKAGRVHPEKSIEWACLNNKRVDVFINIVDRLSRSVSEHPKKVRTGVKRKLSAGSQPKGAEAKVTKWKKKAEKAQCSQQEQQPSQPVEEDVPDPVAVLYDYRKKLNLPNAKLITVSLSKHNGSTTDGTHEGVLDVVGLDEHTPKVIDAFCRSHFI